MKAIEKKGKKAKYIPNYDHLFEENSQEKVNAKPKIINKILKMNFWAIVLSTVMKIIQNAPLYVGAILTADIINIISDASRTEFLKPILIDAGIFLLLLIIHVPITYLRHIYIHKISRNINGSVKSVVVRKLQSLSITYHKDIETGKVQAKFLKDTDALETLFLQIIDSIIPNLILAIIYCVIALYRSKIVSLCFLLIIPINLFLTTIFRNKIRKSTREYRVATENLSHNLLNIMVMMPITKSHGLEEVEYVGFKERVDSFVKKGIIFDKNIGFFGSIIWVASEILKLACLVFCCILAVNGTIKVGDVVLYQTLFSSISNAISNLIAVMPSINVGLDASRSISEIMNIKDIEVNLGKGDIPKICGNIEFKNVTYAYPNSDKPIIKNVSFKVKKGECIAVVGASGSGKSTIMNMIIGFLKPQAGEILVDDKSLSEMDLTAYRHTISVVPQTSILFAGSIEENITYGMKKYSKQALYTAIEKANLQELIDDLPDGINTNIGEQGGRLSGGQKQRITIARALIRNPKILILDEATSALDNISEYNVQKAINQSIEGRTTFIVAHRLSTIRNADKIIVLKEGEIVEMGTYEELMDKGGEFYKLKCLNDASTKEAEMALA